MIPDAHRYTTLSLYRKLLRTLELVFKHDIEAISSKDELLSGLFLLL